MVADDDYRDRIVTLFAGRNDYGIAGQVESNIATMVVYQSANKHIVMTVLNDNTADGGLGGTQYNQIKTINDNSLATYLSNVLDIRAQLVAAGAPAGAYADATRFALDQWPNTLRTNPGSDPIHLNDTGYQFIHGRVKAFIDAKGW